MSTYLIDLESNTVNEVSVDCDGSRIPCPFHEGRDKNCQVGPENGFFCYVCGAKGLALDEDEYYEWQKKEKRRKGDSYNNISFPSRLSLTTPKTSGAAKKTPTDNTIIWDEVVREHVYRDIDGNPVYKKTYFKTSDGGKTPIQYRYEHGKWKPGLTYDNGKKVTLIPYNLKNIISEDNIIFTEGEKDVDTLLSLGITNATTLGSANSKMEKHQWKFFRNKKIIIMPDNDKIGYMYVRNIGRQLYHIAQSVDVCFLQGFIENDKCDITDWLTNINPKPMQILLELKDKQEANTYMWRGLSNFTKSFIIAKELWKYEETIGDNIPFPEAIRNYEKFPIGIFPQEIQIYVNGMTESLDCPIDWVACSVLSISAGLIGNAVILCTGYRDWVEKSNLALILTARSGTGKSHPLRKALKIIYRLDKEEKRKHDIKNREYERKLKKKSSDDTAVDEKPVRKRYLLHDITLEQIARALSENPRGLIWYTDEFAEILKGLNQYKGHGNDRERLMKLLDGITFEVTRGNYEHYVSQPAITLFGTIQPKVIPEFITTSTKESGFAYRFLFCNAEFEISEVRADADDEVVSKLNNLIYSLINIPVSYKGDEGFAIDLTEEERSTKYSTIQPINITFTKEAKDQALHYHNAYFRQLKIGYRHDDLIVGIVSKIETYFVKFCLILHCIEYGKDVYRNNQVDVVTVNKAFRLAQYFLYHNYKTLRDYKQGRSSYDLIKKWSDRKGKKVFTVREVQQGNRAIVKADQAREALEEIENMGKGQFIDDGKKFRLIT